MYVLCFVQFKLKCLDVNLYGSYLDEDLTPHFFDFLFTQFHPKNYIFPGIRVNFIQRKEAFQIFALKFSALILYREIYYTE